MITESQMIAKMEAVAIQTLHKSRRTQPSIMGPRIVAALVKMMQEEAGKMEVEVKVVNTIKEQPILQTIEVTVDTQDPDAAIGDLLGDAESETPNELSQANIIDDALCSGANVTPMTEAQNTMIDEALQNGAFVEVGTDDTIKVDGVSDAKTEAESELHKATAEAVLEEKTEAEEPAGILAGKPAAKPKAKPKKAQAKKMKVKPAPQ